MLRRRARVPAELLKGAPGFAKKASPFFVVRVNPNGLDHPRFAVVVSIKVDKRAAARHALKRRVTARLLRKRFAASRDVIVSVLPPARNLSRKDLYAELDKLLESL